MCIYLARAVLNLLNLYIVLLFRKHKNREHKKTYTAGLHPLPNVAQTCQGVTKPSCKRVQSSLGERVCACVNVSRRTETAPTPLHILVKPPHKLVETWHRHFKTAVKTCQIGLLPYHNRSTTLSQTFGPNSCRNGPDFWHDQRRFNTVL